MAGLQFPKQARSVLSYHDEIWNISWGEKDTIAAVREEMLKEIQQGSLQSNASKDSNIGAPWRPQQAQPQAQPQMDKTASYQLPRFQAVGLMMASIPGTVCQLPAIVFTAQAEQSLSTSIPTEAHQTSTPQAKMRSRKTTSKSVNVASAVAVSRTSVSDASKDKPSSNSLSTTGGARPTTSTDDGEHSCQKTICDGELPSVGSEGHFDGSCKRCAFFPKGRCLNGKDCTHCHFPHEARSRLRKRAALKAQKCTLVEESGAPENILQEDACLSEVLLYLSEPAATASASYVAGVPSAENQHDTNLEAPKSRKNTDHKDELREAMVTTFNNALQEVAQAYMPSVTDYTSEHKFQDVELPSSNPYGDAVDLDTTPSVSAQSDGEDTATVSFAESEKTIPCSVMSMSKQGAPSDTSDSEIASLQEVAAGATHVDQEISPVMSHKCDVFVTSPTSWMAGQRNRKVGLLESCTTADIARMTRSLLNKLTEERFESLCNKILSLPLSTTEQLAVLVAEIFQKATTQDCFRFLYTELCMRIDKHFAPQTSSIGGKAFRRALVTECQATFERSLQPPDASLFVDLNGDERFEVEMKLKTRRLGNMRFIGDLLVRRLLAPKLMPPIVHQLLNHDEAALESLIALLTIVSPEFEMKPSLYQAPLRDAFATLQRKMNNKAVCSRMRCQIQDLLDAKAQQWAPRSTSA